MNRMIKWLVGKMVQCGACTADDTDVMCYGLDLLFSSALLIPALLTAGCAAGHGISTFLLLAATLPLQSFGGGYHCQTHLRCYLLTTLDMLAALACSLLLSTAFLLGYALASGFFIFKLAPVEHPNAPFGLDFRAKMKKIVRLSYCLETGLSALLILCNAQNFARPILAAVSLSALSILSAYTKEWNAGYSFKHKKATPS